MVSPGLVGRTGAMGALGADHSVRCGLYRGHVVNYVYDQNGRAIGSIQGRYIHAMNGRAVGQLNGSAVHALSGSYVGELDHQMIVDKGRGDPGNPGDPGDPGNRGAAKYGYRDVSGKLFG